MKKLITLFSIPFVFVAGSFAQVCSSAATTYDLTVTNGQVEYLTSAQYTSIFICTGGQVIDSSLATCTRIVHIESGGQYDACINAFIFAYVKSGGTFNANNNGANINTIKYESGASILNYTGTPTLCSSIQFQPSSCTSGILDDFAMQTVSVYPNPCNSVLNVDFKSTSDNAMICIYDITGKKLSESIVSGTIKNRIDVSTILPGIYSYRLTEKGKQSANGKFVIIR